MSNVSDTLAAVLGGLNALQAGFSTLAARLDAVEANAALLDSLAVSPPMPPPSPTPPLPPAPPPSHPTVVAWQASLNIKGTDASGPVISAHSLFMRTLDAAGITPLIARLNTFSGNDLTAALVPLIQGSGYESELGSENGYLLSGGPAPAFSANYSLAKGLIATSGFLSTGQYISHSNLTDTSSPPSDGSNLHLSMLFLDPPAPGRNMGVNRWNVWSRHYLVTATEGT